VTTNTAVPPSNGEATSATAQTHNGLQGGPQRSPGLTAKNEVTKGDTAPADDKTNAAKTACQDPCLADRPRRVRVRTATEGPEVARLPLGRPAAPSDGLLANPPDGTAEELQGSAQDNATATTTPSSENDNRAHSSGAPAKKPQTTARSQNRPGNEPGIDWRGDRADPWVGRVDTNNRGGRPGHVYPRDGSYVRQGFWDWSR
jgi:hypothetical protein